MQNKTNKKGGFTLIEMLIVISVIAILSGITLTGITAFTSRARDTQRIGDLRNIQPALELYFNKCGYYPGQTGSGVSGCDHNITDWSEFQTAMDAVGADVPNDPVPSKTYYYAFDSDDGLDYRLGAELENDNNVLRDDLDSADVPTSDYTKAPATMTCDDSDLQYCIGT